MLPSIHTKITKALCVSKNHKTHEMAWHATHKYFVIETHNVRFSLFGSITKPYFVWSVIFTVYNLPPQMCMKQPYIFLNMVILGKTSL